MPIVEIQVKGVRGIRKELTIPLHGKSLLIQGDNGTGKSSVEKSLRWALLGTEVPTAAVSFADEASFRRHILEPIDSPMVRVKLKGEGSIEVAPNAVIADEQGSAFRNACIKGNPFLRRSEILSFLLSRPVDRFTYLETFLDLAAIDEIAAAYGTEVDRCESKLVNLGNQLEGFLRSIAGRLPEAFRLETAKWADLEASFIKYAIDLSLLNAGQSYQWPDLKLASHKAKVLSEGDRLEKTKATLMEMKNGIEEFLAQHLSKSLPDIGGLYKETESLKESTADASISDLLMHVRLHLDTSPSEVCPICGNIIDRERVLDDLARRLSSLESYQTAERQVRSALGAWRAALADFVSTCRKIIASLQLEHIASLDDSLKMLPGFELFDAVDKETDNAKVLAQIMAVGPEQIVEWMTSVAKAAMVRVQRELSALPAASRLGDLRVFVCVIEDADEKSEAMLALETELNKLTTRKSIAVEIAESLRRARQDVAKDTMTSISTIVAAYYEHIHPSDEPYEATGAPSLKIQRHGKGTAFVEGKFAGRDIPDPKWVYSDGHLDTVGICVFLALRRFRGDQAGDSRLLVLDDVVLSIDLPHARRLINLLRDKFSDHQIIILTHNGLFAHWCGNLLPGIQRMTINTWTLEEGPRLGEYVSAMGLVENSIVDQPAKGIAVQVMILMDEWLAECRYAYSLAVPAKWGEQYTLTEIWEPFTSTIKKIGHQLSSDLGGAVNLVDELRDLPAVRNSLAAHENAFAREFPRTTMVDIANKCLALVRSLYCTECRSFAVPVPHRFDPVIVHCDCCHIQYVRPSPALN